MADRKRLYDPSKQEDYTKLLELLAADSESEDENPNSQSDSDEDVECNESNSDNENEDVSVDINTWFRVSKETPVHLNLCSGDSFDLTIVSDPVNFSSQYSAFTQFMPRSVFVHVADQTNLYAQQFLDKTHDFSPRSRYAKWKDCTTEDIEAMVAMEIGMGMCRKPSLKDYFSETSWLLRTPNFGEVMSRDKYFLLRSFVHFNNNANFVKKGLPEYDPLFKIRPIIEMTKETYLQHVQPGKCVSVDETMLKFTGRLWFKQYLPSKPSTKWGIKLWSLCDSKTGFLCKFDTYVGKGSGVKTGETLGEHVVKNLLRGFEKSN
ncbi:piggyBac transposable element-derived protein 4-like [Bacillus rossius redtenbacheri]|uniref:piggyBac transposable element-derived protein 4-like n=1 Tax=Bacillus rossius redtenbacheri TaxID=93214 RepID=UPI002FDD395F